MKPLLLGGLLLHDGEARRCSSCRRFLSKGPIRETFQCKSCNEIYLTSRVNYLDIKRYNDSLLTAKQKVLATIITRKTIKLPTLRREHSDVPLDTRKTGGRKMSEARGKNGTMSQVFREKIGVSF